jgi:hypothetical protein
MHAIKVTDSSGTYIVTFAKIDPDFPSYHVTACYRFLPGRSNGETIQIKDLPLSARIIVADVTRDEISL